MLLSWFDAGEAKEFGANLAHYFIERSPLEVSVGKGKFAAKKQEELLGKMSQQVHQFKSTRKLNVYKKAQVGNVFKWTLTEAGYDRQYVDQLTKWLMLRF